MTTLFGVDLRQSFAEEYPINVKNLESKIWNCNHMLIELEEFATAEHK
jgi:hypothetical protein